MNLAEIRQIVSLKLGEQTAFYTQNEIDRVGINPAQRLLCLAYPAMLRQRATVTVNADLPFVDLRQVLDTNSLVIGNRIRRVNRVVIGTVTGDAPTRNAATGELRELRYMSLNALSSRSNDWMRLQGEVRYYWLYGPFWLGLYKRPVATTTITVIYDAVPAPLVANTDEPQIVDVYHRLIADVAAALLTVKEGIPQGQQGLARLVQSLALERGTRAS